jgi:hypothetical protein
MSTQAPTRTDPGQRSRRTTPLWSSRARRRHHPAYRTLSLPPCPDRGRTARQGLHPVPRRHRPSDRKASPLRTWRPHGDLLLVSLEKAMVPDRPLRQHSRSAQRSPPHHRCRTDLCGWKLIQTGPKMCKVELSSTLHILRREAHGFDESLQECARNFYVLWLFPGYRKIRKRP